MLKAKRDFRVKQKKLNGFSGFNFILCFLIFFILLPTDEWLARANQKTSYQQTQATPIKESPRKDLYQQITHQTGVSLREIFDLVFKRSDRRRNKRTWARLSIYTDQKGIQGIYQNIEQRIQALKAYCDGTQKTECYPQIDDLKKEQDGLKHLQSKAKTDKRLSLYYHLLILTYAIKTDVFRKANLDFAEACPIKKINSDSCRAKRRGIKRLYDIADRLKQLALERPQKKDIKQIASHIDQLIATYE